MVIICWSLFLTYCMTLTSNRLETSKKITFTLTFLHDLEILLTLTYSRLSGMVENHTIESNIIEVVE